MGVNKVLEHWSAYIYAVTSCSRELLCKNPYYNDLIIFLTKKMVIKLSCSRSRNGRLATLHRASNYGKACMIFLNESLRQLRIEVQWFGTTSDISIGCENTFAGVWEPYNYGFTPAEVVPLSDEILQQLLQRSPRNIFKSFITNCTRGSSKYWFS